MHDKPDAATRGTPTTGFAGEEENAVFAKNAKAHQEQQNG